MTSAVLYGTTSDNELRPVQVTDSGEFVTDGGGVRDWYENFYIGGTEGAPSISLLSDGSITAKGRCDVGDTSLDDYCVAGFSDSDSYGGIYAQNDGTGYLFTGLSNGTVTASIKADGTITTVVDVYCRTLYQSVGYDLQKIGMALSTIHDVLDSVDDLQGLKNLFQHLFDNLKSDPLPPVPPVDTSPNPPE